MELVIGAVVVIALFSLFMWAMGHVVSEAERKLGRELTFVEIMLGAMGGPMVILFVLWVLPEAPAKK